MDFAGTTNALLARTPGAHGGQQEMHTPTSGGGGDTASIVCLGSQLPDSAGRQLCQHIGRACKLPVYLPAHSSASCRGGGSSQTDLGWGNSSGGCRCVLALTDCECCVTPRLLFSLVQVLAGGDSP
jgi:hypothetical protein